MYARLLIFVLVSSTVMPSPAQLVVRKMPAKDDALQPWQAEMEQVERRSAKSLLPVHQILMSELEVQARSLSTLSAPRQVDLALLQATVQEREQALSKGKMWLPGPQEAGWEAFCRAAQGKTWLLEGTTNVRKLRVQGKDLMLVNDQGLEFRPTQQRAAAQPGAFLTRRSDGGYSVYLISPDLQQIRCLVVRHTGQGISHTATMPMFAKVSPDQIPAQILQTSAVTPKPSPSPQDQDLLATLVDRVRQSEITYHTELLKIFANHIRQSLETRQFGSLFALQKLVQQHQRALAYLTAAPSNEAPVLSQESFLKQVPEGRWLLPGMGQRGHPWTQFDGQFLRFLNTQGEEGGREPVEIVWPGLISCAATPSRRPYYIAFSADLTNSLYLPNVTGTYRGKLLAE